MNIEWNRVTWYSKLAAVIIFGLTFWLGFYLGMQWQFISDQPLIMLSDVLNQPFPSGSNNTAEGQQCGGFIQNAPTCPASYHCQLNKIADLGGVCVHD